MTDCYFYDYSSVVSLCSIPNNNIVLLIFYYHVEDLFTNEECTPNGSKCDLVQIFQIIPDSFWILRDSSLPSSSKSYDHEIPYHLGNDKKNVTFLSSFSNQVNLKNDSSVNHLYGNCKFIYSEHMYNIAKML